MKTKHISINLIVQVIVCMLSLNSLAQKHFSLTVKLPPGVIKDKVEVHLDNGKQASQIKSQPSGDHHLLLQGEYYSLYAYISIQTQTGLGTTEQTVGNSFFIQDKPGVVEFHPTDSINILSNYSLTNVVDFKDEKKQMAIVDTAERRIGREMETKYGENLVNGNDTAASHYYFRVLRNAQGRKQLEYIIKHPDSYYSFYTFRSEVAGRQILPADSMLFLFNTLFPEKFRYSDEGNFLNDQGRFEVGAA